MPAEYKRPLRVTHIISRLNAGTAAGSLQRLLTALDPARVRCRVISLTDSGLLGPTLEQMGVPVSALGMRSKWPNPAALLRLTRWLRADQPDIVQTWMYHADLIGGITGLMAHHTPVIWGVRHNNLDLRANKLSTLLVARLGAWLSGWLPGQIVCSSHSALLVHQRIGYCAKHLLAIANGLELHDFKPDGEARLNLRNELAISGNVPLIGLVARFHPRKDHHNFARAAARFAQWDRTARFVLCGAGVDRTNQQLMGWLRESGVLHRTHLLGHRTDIARLMPGLDLLTSTSFSEGFPKVIAQAMACGVPVVATDTGDSREIIANTGCIVPLRDPDALAQGWKRLLDLPQAQRQDLANAARRRACEQYALVDVARRYETLYQDVVARRRP